MKWLNGLLARDSYVGFWEVHLKFMPKVCRMTLMTRQVVGGILDGSLPPHITALPIGMGIGTVEMVWNDPANPKCSVMFCVCVRQYLPSFANSRNKDSEISIQLTSGI